MGILPKILFGLIGARGRAKKDMAAAELAQEWSRQIAFNCRQLALKISANSVYGFTGATIGALPCLEVSASVTGFGRDMIELTVQTVQQEFTIANGYEGNAEVIYGDTDSVMVRGLGDTVEKSMTMGKKAAKFVTDSKFIKPIALEFEKVYFPYLLVSKKRYAGLLWTKPHAPDKLDQKGLETVRRDNCNLVRMSMKRSLDAIIKERNPSAALEYVKQILSDLMSNKIDISHLVISKSYSKREEDYKSKQTHIELNKKIIKRAGGDKNLGYMLGDRIPYVLVSGRKKELVCNKAEDPIFVLENNIPIDTASYVGMLKRPLLRIFKAVEKNAESILFSGPHMTHHVIPTPKATRGSIMKFTRPAFSCLSCKTSVRTSQAMCSHCEEKSSLYYLKQLSDIRRLEGEFSRLWTHCQSCQTSFHQEILCSAKQCPIFYKRTSTRIALSSANETLQRFDDVPDW
jgi:DNA polymerase delta subunit 1